MPRPFDSSKTRVAPVFDRLMVSRADWLPALLALPEAGASRFECDKNHDLRIAEGWWGANERGLQPPVSLLSWLIRNLPVAPPDTDTSEAAARRRLLHQGDPTTIEEGLRRVRSGGSTREWFLLEGQTYPDAFIATPDALIVVEGKRTEAGPTTSTTWMPGRRQMLRHLDAAWEIRGRRNVYGLFIVEATAGTSDPPAVWKEAATDTASAEAISQSLPHRSPEERDGIVRSFLGVTTWQAVCGEFTIPVDGLPQRAAGGEAAGRVCEPHDLRPPAPSADRA